MSTAWRALDYLFVKRYFKSYLGESSHMRDKDWRIRRQSTRDTAILR